MPSHAHNLATAERLSQLAAGAGTPRERTALLCAALDQAELAGENRHSRDSELAAALVTAWNLLPEGGALSFHRRPQAMLAVISHGGAAVSEAMNAEPELALAELLGRECARIGIRNPQGPTPLLEPDPMNLFPPGAKIEYRAPARGCDHKFIDSTRCLKCGWDPSA